LKTKKRPETARPNQVINIVGADAVLFERVRASQRRGPFSFQESSAPLPPDTVDLYALALEEVGDLPRLGVPVIAWGPAGMLRSAFLAGCVDYLREPWAPEELALRAITALGRARSTHVFPWGEADFQGDTIVLPGGPAALTHHEALILRALLRSRGSPVPRETLFLLAGGSPRAAPGRTIDVQVASIRRKVRAVAPDAGRFIACVRRQGYMLP
jgi:CheY-like chemotaxis protein